MEALSPRVSPPSLFGIPFEQQWDLLKPTIEQLYIHENWRLSDVVEALKDQYGFNAIESQYKYQIKKWKLKKNTSTSKKAALCQVIQTRAQLGKSSVVTRGGQNVDTKKLRRYLKNEARREIALKPTTRGAVTDDSPFSGHIALFGNRIFMNWNMPYGAMKSSAARAENHLSPVSDVLVTTPQSPHDAPSPMALAVRAMTAVDRARLFVEGKHNDLLRSMGKEQRLTMSNWMYQFWFFSFKTAKHWGRGPQDWTAEILRFNDYHQNTTVSITSANTPAADMGNPFNQSTPREENLIDPTLIANQKRPPSLCRWSIHYRCEIEYESLPSPPRNVDLNDEEQNWPTWSGAHDDQEYTEKRINNLESNDFSNVRLNDLPIAVNQIARAARRSPGELLEEALGFSIMSRNQGLLSMTLGRNQKHNLDISGLYPFHLAVSYLDGSRTCCKILDILEDYRPRSLRKLFVNDLGHTILDQLMIAIVKAHTSCLPSVVDVVFKRQQCFEGGHVDVCGRWDADSDCIRALLANGTSSIPFEWKHMFCHTSIQTICHCLGTVFGPRWGPDINAPSGLFVRRCSCCGSKLQPFPLHTLVLVGFHLSQSGCEGENLFGIVACLLCLLSNGANPLLKAQLCWRTLLGNEEVDQEVIECSHEELDAPEFAERALACSKLTSKLQTGWEVICNVLRHSQAEWRAKPSQVRSAPREKSRDDELNAFFGYSEDGMSIDEAASEDFQLPAKCLIHHGHKDQYDYGDVIYRGDHKNYFGKSKVLASLWAAVQTELLTYRRLEEGHEWISENFNMQDLNEGLRSGDNVAIALVQKEMMNPFCDCGVFPRATPACPTNEDAAAYYFSNLEDWNRSTFVEMPEAREKFWYNE